MSVREVHYIPDTGYIVHELNNGDLVLYRGNRELASCGDWSTVMQAIDEDE